MRTRHVPQRSCIICGTKTSKRELFRVVLSPEGRCSVDETGKSAGRGAYLCHRQDCWERGLRGERLDRALHGTVSSEDREQLVRFGQSLLEAAQSPS